MMREDREKVISRRDFLVTGAAAATAVSGFPFIGNANAQNAPLPPDRNRIAPDNILDSV